MILKKEFRVLLWILSISFMLLILIFGFYSRKAHDDYALIAAIRDHGVVRANIDWYVQMHGRWATDILMTIFVQIQSKINSLIIFSSVVLILQIASVYYCLKSIACNRLNLSLSESSLFLFSALITCQYFFYTFNIGESWFWITGSCSHFFPVIFALFGISLLLKKEKKQTDRISYIILFLLVGGCSEPFAVIVCTALFLNLIYQIYQKKTMKISAHIDNIFPLAACGIGLSFLLLAPGQISRYESALLNITNSDNPNFIKNPSLINVIPAAISSIKHYIKFILPPKVPYFLLFMLPWIYIGNKIRNEMNIKENKGMAKTMIVASFILFFILLSYSSWITAYGAQGIGGKRVWCHIAFYLTILTLITGLSLGYLKKVNERISKIIFIFSVAGIILLNIGFVISEYPLISAYAKAEDSRISMLKTLNSNGQRQSLEIDSLPSSGILKSNELSVDIYDQYRCGLDLTFQVKLKEN